MHFNNIEHQVKICFGKELLSLFLSFFFFNFNYYYIRRLCFETEINCGCLKCDNFKLHSLAPEWMKCLTKVVENWRNVICSRGIHLNAVIQVRLSAPMTSDSVARVWASSHKGFKASTHKSNYRTSLLRKKESQKQKEIKYFAAWRRLLLPEPEVFPSIFVLMKHWFTIMWHHLPLMSSGFKQTTRWLPDGNSRLISQSRNDCITDTQQQKLHQWCGG